MNEMYLHRDDLKSILEFLDSFPDKDIVLVTSDTRSGIGSIVKAHIMCATINGHMADVTKTISDESTW